MIKTGGRIGLWQSGDPFIWWTGGALGFSLLMVAGLVLLILVNGMGYFWPATVREYQLQDGRTLLGSLADREEVYAPEARKEGKEPDYRIKLKVANRSLANTSGDFLWVNEADIVSVGTPPEAVVMERREWGDFIGYLQSVQEAGKPVAEGHERSWQKLEELVPRYHDIHNKIEDIGRNEIGDIATEQEEIRLDLKRLERQGVSGAGVETLKAREKELEAQFQAKQAGIAALRAKQKASVVMLKADGKTETIAVANIYRPYTPNAMGFFAKCGHYASKVWEFVWENPRESNTEGGVFPAIFGTVLMVMIMSIVVTPAGVLAAFYLREYAKQGTMVSTVRIAVNNLAGVPSIVFGFFGVGFFIYIIGGSIDQMFYAEKLPTPTWGTGGILWASLTLALLTVPVVIVATEEGLAAVPNGLREASLALGATKFETTWRVVMPSVMPSILTGLILAMARAAGEVAPLMITGVVKLAPSLPVDNAAPYLHLDRKFMHLGFHIYDVGFQSPNVDAARPMVYTTTLLLLLIVVALNLFAITIRNRLRRKFATSAV